MVPLQDWDVVTGVLALLAVVAVHLLIPGPSVPEQEARVNYNHENRKAGRKASMTSRARKAIRPLRRLWRSLSETIWVYGVGAMAAHWPP